MKPWRVPYRKFGDGPGLERVAALAQRLDIDLAGFGENGAVIVGSNGKGSTAAMTAALLQAPGVRVGLFTSPHLLDLNERFRIDGEDIADEELQAHWMRVVGAIDAEGLAEKIGGFEFLFLIAADWFALRGCAHTVWEAGIGGRLDPTRLIRAKNLALTSLDLEHAELLGNTLLDIGLDKIQAAPPGSNLYAGVWSAERTALARRCAEMGVRYVSCPPYYPAVLPLSGKHQNQNAALALNIAMQLTGLESQALEPRLAQARWPGRLEVIEQAPLIVVDVGHTPAAVRAALEGFEAMRGPRRGILVCGVSQDKKANELMAVLAPAFDTIICTAAAHKGAPAAQIALLAKAANPSAELVVSESVADARRSALARAKSSETAIYVAGSLFLAAAFKAVHMGRDPATLAFF